MQILKQSTGVDVRVGPAVDATDGVTPETGLALGTADQAELLKHDGAATVDISSNTFAAVTGCDGWYDLTLTTTDTNTLGMATVVVQDSSLMLPIFKDFMVVPANVWDSLFGADLLDVNVEQWDAGTVGSTVSGVPHVDVTLISQSSNAAQNLEESTETMVTGAAATGTLTTTTFTTNLTISVNDQYNGRSILFKGDVTAALAGQASVISDTVTTNGQLTVAQAFTTAPANGDSFVIV